MRNRLATVFFSKDRPIQLELALRTHDMYSQTPWKSHTTQTVLYAASDDRYQSAYDKLAKMYPRTIFMNESNFKKDLLKITSESDYIMFVVDDTIFVRNFNTCDIIQIINYSNGILGFSLRLGRNTTNCYAMNKPNIIPRTMYHTDLSSDVSFSDWTRIPSGDFGYPFEVSSSIYKTSDILIMLKECPYYNPNTLEWYMDSSKALYGYKHPYLAYYNISAAFSNPLNKVNKNNANRSGDNPRFSVENLLEKFEEGYIVDSSKFEGFISNGCHQVVDLEFRKV